MSKNLTEVTVDCLVNQLEISVQLLEAAMPGAKDSERRTRTIELARQSYGCSAEQMGKLPPLEQESATQLANIMRQFRVRLAELTE